jgi:hypothetical protein
MKTILSPIAPDAPHPFLKDGDGGALVVDGNEPRPKGRANHPGMTAGDRIRFGHGTAEDFQALKEHRAAHAAWQRSPQGRAWLESKGLKPNTVKEQADGTKVGAV